MARWPLIGILVVALVSTGDAIMLKSAKAQVVENPYFPYRCVGKFQMFIRPTNAAPELINATLARLPSLSFAMCNDQYENSHYFMFTRNMGSHRVCVLRGIEVFPEDNPNKSGASGLQSSNQTVRWDTPPTPWRSKPTAGQKGESTRRDGTYFASIPTVEMVNAESGCPPADSKAFVSVQGISETEFKKIDVYWQQLISSKAEFDRALSGLEAASLCEQEFAWDKGLEEGMKKAQAQIRDGVFDERKELRIGNLSKSGRSFYAILDGVGWPQAYAATFLLSDHDIRLRCLYSPPIP
jgi:hypothetical protein